MNDFPALRRRGFLTAVGGTAALGVLGLTGCADSTGDTSDGSGSDNGTPRRGGRLRAAFAGGSASETLDPHLASLFADAARAKALYDKLADYGADLSAQPRLAEIFTTRTTSAAVACCRLMMSTSLSPT